MLMPDEVEPVASIRAALAGFNPKRQLELLREVYREFSAGAVLSAAEEGPVEPLAKRHRHTPG